MAADARGRGDNDLGRLRGRRERLAVPSLVHRAVPASYHGRQLASVQSLAPQARKTSPQPLSSLYKAGEGLFKPDVWAFSPFSFVRRRAGDEVFFRPAGRLAEGPAERRRLRREAEKAGYVFVPGSHGPDGMRRFSEACGG